MWYHLLQAHYEVEDQLEAFLSRSWEGDLKITLLIEDIAGIELQQNDI